MKRVAIFVEGQTEQVLVEDLLRKIATNATLHIEFGEQFRNALLITASPPGQGVTHNVLLVNCKNDEQVKTQILNNYSSMVSAKYDMIVGLRDVYPFPLIDAPKVEKDLGTGLPTGPVPIYMHLGIMEIEAWFLAETTHFERVHAGLTQPRLLAAGWDLLSVPAQQWTHPAAELHAIYSLENLAYKKKKKHALRTVAALSWSELQTSVRARVVEFDSFLSSLELALS